MPDAPALDVREQARAIGDVLLGSNSEDESPLVAGVRRAIEPPIIERLDAMQSSLDEVRAAQAEGPPTPADARRSPPPWAASGAFPGWSMPGADMTRMRAMLGIPDASWHNPDAPGAALDGEFESLTDFVGAVFRAGRKANPVIDKRLVFMNEAGKIRPAATLTGEELELGGALVPEEFRPTLLMMQLQPTSIRSRAMVLPIGAKSVEIPAIRTATHADGTVFGGVTYRWTEVNKTIRRSEPEFKTVELNARTLAGSIEIPNTLIADSFIRVPALIMQLWQMAVPWIEESVFIRGDGVGKSLGILNSPALVQIDRAGAANTGTFTPEDAYNMLAALPPGSATRAVWMIHPQMIPALGTMNANDVQVWQPALTDTMPNMLLGKPVIFNEHMSAPNVLGDVMLIDWLYYIIADRMALMMSSSAHEMFSDDITVLKGISRFDGQPWLDTSIIPANRSGSTFAFSPFVGLAGN